jgi:hypothetical protein
MQRIQAAYHTVDNKFTDGDPSTGAKSTFFNAEWCNGVQEELVGLIEASGQTPAAGTYDQVKKALYRLMYPVGSIYMTADLTFSPAATFGGSWVKVSVGRVPVGYDSTQTEFNSVGKQGGEKTHQLSKTEIPKLNVSLGFQHYPQSGSATQCLTGPGSAVTITGTTDTGQVDGTAAPHQNLQPYEVIGNVWKRTAL